MTFLSRLFVSFVAAFEQLTRILKANHMAQTEAEVARKTDTIMAQADKDGDGVVTFDGEKKKQASKPLTNLPTFIASFVFARPKTYSLLPYLMGRLLLYVYTKRHFFLCRL